MNYAADYRRIARETLRGKWKIAVLVGFVALLLGGVAWSNMPEISFQVEGNSSIRLDVNLLGQQINLMELFREEHMAAFWTMTLFYVSVVALIISLAQIVIGCIVQVGYARFQLDLQEGKEGELRTLFQYFPQWKTMLAAGLLQVLYIIGWSLLFVIPGIIAAYRYAMTSYLLAENPELGANEAIALSAEWMRGQKWRLFCLEFSFIGWMFLCAFTMGIGNLWLTPYMQQAQTAFYWDLKQARASQAMAEAN